MQNKDLDNKILNLLDKKTSYPSLISRELGILRTTVQYHLNKLEKIKLINKKIIGRRTMYSIAYNKKGNKNLYKIYSGKDGLIQAYYQLFKIPKESTILVIQGSESAKNELLNLPDRVIKEFHRIVKRKKIIMRGISNKKILKYLDSMKKDMTMSHIGRTQSFRIVSDNRFLSSAEIFSTQKSILLSNPKSKTAIIIKDKEMVMIINDILSFVFELIENNKTFDLNRYLKDKISSYP